jgi:hypothetical protein
MARPLEIVAREVAEMAVSTAQCAGYDISARRAVFFRSDLMSLETDILIWLQDHMSPEESELPSIADVRGILK